MSLTDRFAGKTLCVALAPDRLCVAVRRGSRIMADSAFCIAFEHPEGRWQGALAALQGYLPQAGAALKGLPISVGLSSRWCHLLVLPWSDALLGESAAGFMQAQFAGVFGDAARNWAITCDDAPYGHPRLACAIERDFLEGLQGIALEHGHACVAVEPLLSIGLRAIAASKPQAYALVEPGRLVLAAIAAGRITAVQAQPCRGAGQDELAQAWQRWTLRAPELGDIAEVALVSLDASSAPHLALPARFRPAALPAPLPAAYAAVCLMGR